MQTETHEQRKTASPYDRISMDIGILSGKPAIRGTRIPVSLILNLIAHGYTFERVIEAYPSLETDDIVAALRFAEACVNDARIAMFAGGA